MKKVNQKSIVRSIHCAFLLFDKELFFSGASLEPSNNLDF